MNIYYKTPTIVRITPVFSAINAIFKGQNKYLSNSGCKIIVISSPDETASNTANNEGFDFYPVNISRDITPYKDLKAIVQIVNILNKIRPDVVHTHTSKGGFIGMVASFAANIPNRIHSVAGWSADSRGKIIRMPILLSELVTLRIATRIMINSESLREYLVDSGYISSSKGIVLGKGSSNGVDLVRFQMDSAALINANQVRERFGILKNDIVLVFVGRVMIEKGIKELLEAFSHLNNIYNNIHLMIIGSLEKDSRKILPIELLNILKDKPNIHLTGWVDDVPYYLAAADILIHPSFHEGMSNALLQGAAMEVPCVASNVRGNRDAIIHGVTGYLFQSHNTKDLINLLIPLIESRSLRLSQGKEGRHFIEREFDSNIVCKRLLDFYFDTLFQEHQGDARK